MNALPFYERPDWADFNFYFMDALDVFYVKHRDEQQEGIVNQLGTWIFKGGAGHQKLGMSHFWWESNSERFIRAQQYFVAVEFFPPSESVFIEQSESRHDTLNYENNFHHANNHYERKQRTRIYTILDDNYVELLPEYWIIEALPVSPSKLVLQVAIDKNNYGPDEQASYLLFDTRKGSIKLIQHGTFRDQSLEAYDVKGVNRPFSIANENGLYILFDPEGERLFDCEFTVGPYGAGIDFERSGRSFGIAYRQLTPPSAGKRETSYCLIDSSGSFYGEFSHIVGRVHPNQGYTRCPKFIGGYILCTSLPSLGDTNEYLVIVDREGNQNKTDFQCPWLGTRLFSTGLIEDKKIFGEACLIVVDDKNMVRLINLRGIVMEGFRATPYENISLNYKKYFIDQLKEGLN
jgi:hypothetical protein